MTRLSTCQGIVTSFTYPRTLTYDFAIDVDFVLGETNSPSYGLRMDCTSLSMFLDGGLSHFHIYLLPGFEDDSHLATSWATLRLPAKLDITFISI